MTFSLPTNQGRPVSSVIPVPLETYGYTLTAEFSSDPYFPFFTVKSVTGDGRYVNLALTAEEVDTLQNSHFRIRAIKGDSNKFISVGRLNYIQEPLGPITGPQGPAGIQGVPGATGPAGPKGDTGPSPILPVDLVRTSDLNALGSVTATPDTVARRDANGGFNVGWLDVNNVPNAPQHAARKDYVDAAVAPVVAATDAPTGGTLVKRRANGWFTTPGISGLSNPANSNDAVPKGYVDTAVVDLTTATNQATGSTLAKRNTDGSIAFSKVALSNAPVAINDATRKDYVDTWGPSSTVDSATLGPYSGVIAVSGPAWRRRVLAGNTVLTGIDIPSQTRAFRVEYQLVQAATGGPYTVTWPATGITWLTSVPTMPTTANAVLFVELIWTGSEWLGSAAESDLVAATNVATANTLVRRDAGGNMNAGRVWVSSTPPVAANELTRKDYVDAVGTGDATSSTVVRRWDDGSTNLNQVQIMSPAPTQATHATRKDYVDAAVQDALLKSFLGNSLWSAGAAEPFQRPSNNVVLANDFVTLSCFTAPFASTITKFGVPINNVSSGQTLFRVGLYTINGANSCTLVARSDNTPAVTTSAGWKELPLSTVGGFPASYTFVPGQRYAFGMRAIATTTNVSVVSWFLFEGAQVYPYIAQQLYVGGTAGDLTPGPFTPGGTWWHAPYIAGIK